IPIISFKSLTDFQKNIFKELMKGDHKIKLKTLMENLKTADVKERSFRSKLSYALRDLITNGLIKKKREGKEIILILTEEGKIFSQFLI
ncbi:MAG: hypothetical protein ACP6IY_22070, partial [Promethearchaeia archaeon]